jgi:hypothetical protein
MGIYEIINLSLYLIKRHVMQAYWGVEVWLWAFLTSALDEEWSASRLVHITTRKGGGLTSVRWLGYRLDDQGIEV